MRLHNLVPSASIFSDYITSSSRIFINVRALLICIFVVRSHHSTMANEARAKFAVEKSAVTSCTVLELFLGHTEPVRQRIFPPL